MAASASGPASGDPQRAHPTLAGRRLPARDRRRSLPLCLSRRPAQRTGRATAGFLERVLTHLRRQGVHVQRVLTDNCADCLHHVFRDVAAAHGRPQAHPALSGPRPTARPRPSTRSSRLGGPTSSPIRPNSSASMRYRPSSSTTIMSVHTAASAQPLPRRACKQRVWELQLASVLCLSSRGLLRRKRTRPVHPYRRIRTSRGACPPCGSNRGDGTPASRSAP